ncbi:MAG: hypothetical protein ABR548_02435 [Actinomycetota bacterium]|nr:hypothetical protein [Actinomycetota bacterium]
MAIKGKTKKKAGGARGRAGAPKPIVVERKPHLYSRTWFKRTFWSVVILAAVLGGLRVWQNVSRGNSLLRYDRNLVRSEGLLKQHLGSSVATGLSKNVEDFSAGKLDAKRFEDLGKLWEQDFKSSKDGVAKLHPPGPAKDAQQMILNGVDAYVGVARLYQAAAIQKRLANDGDALAKATKDAVLKKKIEAQAKKDADQVQVLLLHASEWRTRADTLINQGIAQLQDLNAAWHVKAPSLSLTDASGGVSVPS